MFNDERRGPTTRAMTTKTKTPTQNGDGYHMYGIYYVLRTSIVGTYIRIIRIIAAVRLRGISVFKYLSTTLWGGRPGQGYILCDVEYTPRWISTF